MSGAVENESFRAMIALFILGFEVSSRGTSNASSTIPKGLDIWADTLVILEDSFSRAFTFFSDLADLSWRGAIAIARLRGCVEFGACGAFPALLGDGVEKHSSGSITLDTVVRNFIVPISTF